MAKQRRTRRRSSSRHPAAAQSQVRSQIDQGKFRDKVAAADPAIAPLGTDSEAGGHSPAPDSVETAAPGTPAHGPPERHAGPRPRKWEGPVVAIAAGIGAAIATLVVLVVLL